MAIKKPQLLFKPFPKQERFLGCPAFEVLFGGAAGPGKSLSLLMSPLMGMMQGVDGKPVENYHALLLRRKFTDLEKSLIFESHKYYKGRATFDGQARRWKFPNNCSVTFGHCQYERDMYNYESAQYQEIGIDELTDFQEKMYLFFMTRIRTTSANIKTKIRSATNPGGIGHAWVKKRFWIDDPAKKADYAHKVSQEITHPDGKKETLTYERAYIPATVYDNPFIIENNKQYLAQLLEQPESHRRAYLEGRWDMFEGQFFSEWNPQLHVCKEFPIPKHWRRSISFDWGYKDPTCVLWFAEDPDSGIVYCYRELYINNTIDTKVAQLIDEMSQGESIYAIYYPWDLEWANRGESGVSSVERMRTVWGDRYWIMKANKDRKIGWLATRNLLSIREDGRSRMQIFENCRNLIQTIPDQVYDTHKVEDLDTLGNDHAVDSLRYFAATYRAGPETMKERAEERIFDLGAARRDSKGQIFLKAEKPMSFNWMVE